PVVTTGQVQLLDALLELPHPLAQLVPLGEHLVEIAADLDQVLVHLVTVVPAESNVEMIGRLVVGHVKGPLGTTDGGTSGLWQPVTRWAKPGGNVIPCVVSRVRLTPARACPV